MRADQAQIGWFSALPAVQAIDRAEAEVIARTVDVEGKDSYVSSLIVKRGSGITIDDVAACGKKYTFGIGDAQSTSGTLAPLTYFFGPRNINPTTCFSTVRSANHQANSFAVANGQVDVATSNSVNTVFLTRQNPEVARQIEVIWESPPIPESGILVRGTLPAELKARIREFFVNYGQGFGPEADRQKAVMDQLNYSQFRAADNSYLNPIREMKADQARRENRPVGCRSARRQPLAEDQTGWPVRPDRPARAWRDADESAPEKGSGSSGRRSDSGTAREVRCRLVAGHPAVGRVRDHSDRSLWHGGSAQYRQPVLQLRSACRPMAATS